MKGFHPVARKRHFFFGWYIVGLMIIGMALIYGIRSSFAVFFAPVLDEFGWYRGSTAIMLSLNIFIYGLTAPLAGMLVDRWKPRTVVVLGILLLSAATAANYFATELWHFYLLFGVLAPIGTAFCGSPVFNPTVINWFGKKRSLAVGLGQLGGGLSFAYVILVESVISYFNDWRPVFFVMAGLVLAMLPFYLIFFYHRPADKGKTVYGEDGPGAAANSTEVQAEMEHDWKLRTAFRTPQLWLLVFTEVCFWGVGEYMIIAHQVKFAEDAGYSSALAASVFALFGLVSMAGQLCSSISDRIGRETTLTIAVVMSVGALIALSSVKDTSQPWLLYIYSVAAGLGVGLFSPNIIVGTADIYRGRNIGTITALLMTGMGLGGAIGPWLGGYIFDVTGSYQAAFMVAIGAFILGCISFWIAAPRNAEKLRAKKMTSI
jgi:sugar phosphate permease